jgi:hypothetical protein
MVRALHAEHALSDHFITYMLERNIRIERDSIHQLFNYREKRLARILPLLAVTAVSTSPDRSTQGMLRNVARDSCGLVRRSRVSSFMNKFKQLGFIHCNSGIQVYDSLLGVVMHGR